MEATPELIVIGGSWGGIQASLSILKGLPANYKIPIVLVLHRLRSMEGELQHIYEKKLALKVEEIEEKEEIKACHVYLAPANYHVLIEKDRTFSLDVSELENYSRPSIDVTFTSAVEVFDENMIGILLSGANKDGSSGLQAIRNAGGITIIQDPEEAEVSTMPLSALELVPDCKIMKLERIQEFLNSLA
ncbi:chemotaxis protein CheB [Pontibacter silvestris]|uniref:protein-glutamate methylesterase n=1 Tax=Pontibacter silvestris TaxID=2305183 RepID=A0ABW4X2X3_9BACT|nr:chemotaxis protein CheB [Pontibacter silvestris]MCC9135107.1 chemotaxis protein CheB [Pontibacter silvestris]